MAISDLKKAATLLSGYNTIQKLLRLSNEILCILMAKGAAKLQKVKVEGLKKIAFFILGEILLHRNRVQLVPAKIFFQTFYFEL